MRPSASNTIAVEPVVPWSRARITNGNLSGQYSPRRRVLHPQESALPDVEAHITGTVWKIECQVGDDIAEGDTVVILESMKMEMPVEAEDAGTVKEILCEEGQ